MTIELKIPNVGESVQEVQIGRWLKREGERVEEDETVVELDTDKASMELPAPAGGVLAKILKRDGDTVSVGEVIAQIEPGGETREGERDRSAATAEGKTRPGPATQAPPPKGAIETEQGEETEEPAASPSVRRLLREHQLKAQDVRPSGEGGRLLRDDVLRHVEARERPAGAVEQASPQIEPGGGATAIAHHRIPVSPPAPAPARAPGPAESARRGDGEEIVPMSLIRRRIAERLVEARQKAALLTTFNEIDMSAVIEMRTGYREAFQQKYGVKLGFSSFFVKAVVEALREFPAVNAEVRGADIVYHHFYHIGVAIGASRGLLVPVLRDADRLSFAEIEQAIDDFARRAESNKLDPSELAGGTFTITNGGIFGSLLSTPIVNPPQSGVLGMHAIQDRPVARDGQVVIRPMMYVALTYDHRIIDGREAVSFLKRVKEVVESPARLAIGV